MSVTATAAPNAAVAQPATRWERLAPLSGPAFFVLLLISSILAGETPSGHASGAKVLSIFSDHPGARKASSLLATVAVVLLILFAGWLRSHLRERGADALGSGAFAGIVILGVGGAARAGAGWALADGHDTLGPGAAQALNVLYSTHYPAITGIAVLMFAVCAATARTHALPAWLGWAALPIAVAALAPPTLAPLIATGLWIAVAGTVIFVRSDQRQMQTSG
jgi:hypothetical protein